MDIPKRLPNGWNVLKPLDTQSGAQATTYLVSRDPLGEDPKVAKILRPLSEVSKALSREEQVKRFRIEIHTLQNLNKEGCPRIVEVVDTNIDQAGNNQLLFYVMPYYSAGPLFRKADDAYLPGCAKIVGRALDIVIDLAETFQFMHDREFTVGHRDVHTGNIFFFEEDGRPYLGDFGLAFAQDTTSGGSGTPTTEEFGPWRWRPPELTQGSNEKKNPKSDVYMLGGVLYELISGGDYIDEVEPNPGSFAHESPGKNLIKRIDDHRVKLINELLRKVLVRDPLLRLTAAQFREGLVAIKDYEPDQPYPSLPEIPTLTVAESQFQKTIRVRKEKMKPEIFSLVQEIAEEINFREEKPRWQVSRIIDATGGEPSEQSRVSRGIEDYVFNGGVRVLVGVDLQKGEIPFIYSVFWLGRSVKNEEIVLVERCPDHKGEIISHSMIGNPAHRSLIREEALKEMSRLSKEYAEILKEEVEHLSS